VSELASMRPPPRNGNRTFVLRVVVLALAAIIIGELTIALGRGIVCSMKGGCGPEEWANSIELLSGLVATLVALIFALLEGRKP
jgi:hypothetical protein